MIYLRNIGDTNRNALFIDWSKEMMPVIYTPTMSL